MVENPAENVNISAVATTACTAKQPKKKGDRLFKKSSEESLTINAIKDVSAKRFRD